MKESIDDEREERKEGLVRRKHKRNGDRTM